LHGVAVATTLLSIGGLENYEVGWQCEACGFDLRGDLWLR
jgi:hypothetical protein